MAKPPFIEVAIPCPLRSCFDYLLPAGMARASIKPGMRVRVPFGRRAVIGIVVKVKETSDAPLDKLKSIEACIDDVPLLTKEIFHLCLWASHYYQHGLGEVFQTALPKTLREGKEFEQKKPLPEMSATTVPPHVLLEEQQKAFDCMRGSLNAFNVFLLQGITGSGKTEVYFHVIESALKQKKQVLVLVPEISLTPQTIDRFKKRFSHRMVAMHSGLTPSERLHAWMFAKKGDVDIVIGTRSAIFTPMPALGLIVIDEEHDASFKQQEGFRYHARDLAIVRAKKASIPVVLGSATPSMESYYNAISGKYQHLHLSVRPGAATLPPIQLIDLRQKPLVHGLSDSLLQMMAAHLKRDNQVLILINRRGYAPVIYCENCQWQAVCDRCDAKMVFHKKQKKVTCHHCGAQKPLPDNCPACRTPHLIPIGLGTERLEEYLTDHFKTSEVIRIDRDSTRKKGELDRLLAKIQQGKNQLLVGTQMIAKGHHFPNVTLVAVLDIDHGLLSADFRAPEKSIQLMMQVAGRAGREDKPGIVAIQTYQPEHPLLQHLIHHDYNAFASALLEDRKITEMPPFGYLALVRAEAKQLDKVMPFMQSIRSSLLAHKPVSVDIHGPALSPMQRKAGYVRVQLLLRGSDRPTLMQFINQHMPLIESDKRAMRCRWSIDVDPVDLF